MAVHHILLTINISSLWSGVDLYLICESFKVYLSGEPISIPDVPGGWEAEADYWKVIGQLQI